MAEEVRIAQTGSIAKIRHPLGVVGLSLITLGIYFFFWWYFINREMHDLGRARKVDLGENPTNSVLAITLGALVIVPAIVTMWTTGARIESAQEIADMEPPRERAAGVRPAAAGRPGGHLVRPARAQQGLAGSARERGWRHDPARGASERTGGARRTPPIAPAQAQPGA
jgi:hypothetical protein